MNGSRINIVYDTTSYKKLFLLIFFFLKLWGAAASFGKGVPLNFSTAIHVRPAVSAVSAYVLNKLLRR